MWVFDVVPVKWLLGYRGFRIAELLRDRNRLTEQDLFTIQLNTRSAVFDFYQQFDANNHGASERLVLSPSHPENGIFHMPGGQSGHYFSKHYRDQQSFCRDGIAAP